MAKRTTASERMRRVLAIVPWIVANPGRPVAEVADRFGLRERELLDDLNVVFMIGLPPYSPDALVDVEIDDEGCVSIHLADFFSRPLRLTPGQGLALLASADGLLSIPGTDPEGALARALGKLRSSLGVDGDDAVDVHLGDAEAAQLDQLRSAAAGGGEVEIDYYSYGRDERTRRVIAPWRVFSDAGSWYVSAWCSRAEGERVFRVDRIESLTVLDSTSPHRPHAAAEGPGVFHPGPDDPTVTLRLAPSARWVVDAYPANVLQTHDDGSVTVRLVVSALPWLERLLLGLGSAAVVTAADGIADAEKLASSVASRVLARYRADEGVVAVDGARG